MAELRFIENFPIEGVRFIDISPVLADKDEFQDIINIMCEKIPKDVDYIISPESRGYLFGTAIANKLKKGFVPIRKPGKLPEDLVICVEYEKEYGKDMLCLPKSERYKNRKFYFIDDILATGGTINASKELIKKAQGILVGQGVYINLKNLNKESINSVLEI